MWLKRHLFLLLLLFNTGKLYSQCTPNLDFIPDGTNYGLSPDTLTDGVINQPYYQELTFYLPLDTLVDVEGFGETLIDFEDYHITSISLPVGLSWECNNSDNDCHYDPTISQYGCVSITGLPLEYGEFEVQVTVEATHSLSWLVGPELISFDLPLTIMPSLAQNSGFAMTNFSGCAPLTVNFENNNSGLISYNWVFGNGNISNSENPSAQLYSEPGVYEVSYVAYSTLENTHVLTSVEVNNADGWGGDVEDVFGSPDPYFKLFDASGNLLLESNVYVDLSFPVSWSVDNIVLTNQTYTIEVWDQDGPITSDDNLGSVSFSGNSPSTTLSNGTLVVSISVNIIEPLPYSQVVDTVFVYDNPQTPTISYDEMSNELSLDNDSLSVNYQWYFYQSPVFAANNTNHASTFSGYYSLLATNEFGCSQFSNEELVVICNDEFVLEIELSSDTLSTQQYANFNYQWLFNSEPITGANDNVHVAAIEGDYSLILTDEWGCEYKSNQINFNPSDIKVEMANDIRVYPNPSKGKLTVQVGQAEIPILVQIMDLQGRIIVSESFDESHLNVDLSYLQKGIYYIKIHQKNRHNTKRIILN